MDVHRSSLENNQQYGSNSAGHRNAEHKRGTKTKQERLVSHTQERRTQRGTKTKQERLVSHTQERRTQRGTKTKQERLVSHTKGAGTYPALL